MATKSDQNSRNYELTICFRANSSKIVGAERPKTSSSTLLYYIISTTMLS